MLKNIIMSIRYTFHHYEILNQMSLIIPYHHSLDSYHMKCTWRIQLMLVCPIVRDKDLDSDFVEEREGKESNKKAKNEV